MYYILEDTIRPMNLFRACFWIVMFTTGLNSARQHQILGEEGGSRFLLASFSQFSMCSTPTLVQE